MHRIHIPVIILAIALAALPGSSVARFLPALILGFILMLIAQAGETSGLTAFGWSRRPPVMRGRK